jgi:hypothetical protein
MGGRTGEFSPGDAGNPTVEIALAEPKITAAVGEWLDAGYVK